MRLRFGGVLVAVALALGVGSMSLAQEVTPEFVQEKIATAKQGNVSVQFNLGFMYERGQGVRQDYAKAKEYYGQACDSGDQEGCNNYRRLNEAGY